MRLCYVDPAGCNCTDCVTGVACAVDRLSHSALHMLLRGMLISRLGDDAEIEFELHFVIKPSDLRTRLGMQINNAMSRANTSTVTVDGQTFYAD